MLQKYMKLENLWSAATNKIQILTVQLLGSQQEKLECNTKEKGFENKEKYGFLLIESVERDLCNRVLRYSTQTILD